MARSFDLVDPLKGISCHAWNSDGSQIAVCPNDNTLLIYGNCKGTELSSWKLLHTLSEHDLLISSLDWSSVTNQIVTCSHDRNAFVWKYDDAEDQWKPTLVILRIDRAALDVKWSPDGKKFAVASGAKCVPVCYFEPEHDWWVAKMIKRHKSTVMKVAWHPNSQLLATGSSDFKCRVFSAFIRQVDGVPDSDNFAQKAFGEDCWEGGGYGWVTSCAWSPSGNILAFTGHDSSVQFVDFTNQGETAEAASIRFSHLPIETCMFLSENSFVGVGHEKNPLLFTKKDEEWSFQRKLEEKKEEQKEKKASSEVQRARALFMSKTTRGQDAVKKSDELLTTHQTSINCIQRLNADTVTTSGSDGKVVFWQLLPAIFEGLKC